MKTKFLFLVFSLIALMACSNSTNLMSSDPSGLSSAGVEDDVGSVAGNPILTLPKATIANPVPPPEFFFDKIAVEESGGEDGEDLLDQLGSGQAGIAPLGVLTSEDVPPKIVFSAQTQVMKFMNRFARWGRNLETTLSENQILYPLEAAFSFQANDITFGAALGTSLNYTLSQESLRLRLDIFGDEGTGAFDINPHVETVGGQQRLITQRGLFVTVNTNETIVDNMAVLSTTAFDTSDKDELRLARETLSVREGVYRPHRLLAECQQTGECIYEYQTLTAPGKMIAYRFAKAMNDDTVCVTQIKYTPSGTEAGFSLLFDANTHNSLHRSCTIHSADLSWANTAFRTEDFFDASTLAEFREEAGTPLSTESLLPWLKIVIGD